ncbi:MAG: cysteine hydrolase family protein [Eubacteriales bacterium]|nr:cysteine hydrolase family protein [Eubacteriales bacterium]
MKQALIIIDIQNDYFPGGKWTLFGADEALEKAQQILARFRTDGLPVFFIQHIAAPGDTFFEPDTPGVLLHSALLPQERETVVVKHYPSSFRETVLLEELQKCGAHELVFCGMMTHMCVDTTVRAASDLGFSNILIADACATRSLTWNGQEASAPAVQAAYFAALNGSFARVISASEYLAEAAKQRG